MLASTPFGVRETHGILLRPETVVRASSDHRNWSSLYASAQLELPYEGYFGAVKDQLIVLHRDGPTAVHRLPGRHGDRHLVPPGGLHLVPGGMELGVRLAGVVNSLHVYVRREVIEEVAQDLIEGDPALLEIPPSFVDCDDLFLGVLQAVDMALEEDDPCTMHYVDHLARAIAARLIQAHAVCRVRTRKPLNPVGRTCRIIDQAIQYMRDNLGASISLENIARAVNRSPSHFARQFRTELGLPPHQYLVNLRLEKAQQLLAESRMSIAEIAFTCGFSHQKHMTRFFKQRCSTTPAAYRKARWN